MDRNEIELQPNQLFQLPHSTIRSEKESYQSSKGFLSFLERKPSEGVEAKGSVQSFKLTSDDGTIDKKQLAVELKMMKEDYQAWQESSYLQYSLLVCCTLLVCRAREIFYLLSNDLAEQEVVAARYKGDQKLYNRDLFLNCLVTMIIAAIGFLNCYLIHRYQWWRLPVPFINNICLLAFFPMFHTYTVDDLVMMVIPMHIFHILTMMITAGHTWQIISMCCIQFAFDYWQLTNLLEGTARVYQNRFNLGLFAVLYILLCWGGSKQFNTKTKLQFVQQKKMRAINEEFKEILKHTPEGVMITRVEEKGQPDLPFMQFSPQETNSNKIDSVLDALKQRYDTKIQFLNEAMENFISDSKLKCQDGEPTRSLFEEKMFLLYDFGKRADDSLGHFRNYTVAGRQTIYDDMTEKQNQEKFLFSLQELFILYQSNPKKTLLFEIVDPKHRESSVSLGNFLTPEYRSSKRNIVEIKLQEVTFLQQKCILLKIINVNSIVQTENYKMRASYSEALTATVSHEQMTPLNSIVNMAELLISQFKASETKEDPYNDQNLNALRVIHSSSQMMKLLNQSLLDSQAVSDGSLRLNYGYLNPVSVINELLEYFEFHIQAKGIKVSVSQMTMGDTTEFPKEVICEEMRFKEIAFHILSNAIKFNKERNGQIEIVLGYDDSYSTNDEAVLHLEIHDTGIGMTKEQIANSCETFGNLDVAQIKKSSRTNTRNQGGGYVMTTSGVGIGIPTSRKLAKALGGGLEIKSQRMRADLEVVDAVDSVKSENGSTPLMVGKTSVFINLECYKTTRAIQDINLLKNPSYFGGDTSTSSVRRRRTRKTLLFGEAVDIDDVRRRQQEALEIFNLRSVTDIDQLIQVMSDKPRLSQKSAQPKLNQFKMHNTRTPQRSVVITSNQLQAQAPEEEDKRPSGFLDSFNPFGQAKMRRSSAVNQKQLSSDTDEDEESHPREGRGYSKSFKSMISARQVDFGYCDVNDDDYTINLGDRINKYENSQDKLVTRHANQYNVQNDHLAPPMPKDAQIDFRPMPREMQKRIDNASIRNYSLYRTGGLNINCTVTEDRKESGSPTSQRSRNSRIEIEIIERIKSKVEEAPKCQCVATALIVDDNPFNLLPLKMLLKQHEIQVVEAHNGAQAVEAFVVNRNQSQVCNCGTGILLVMMDINMPIMDGCTATQQILKKQQEYEAVQNEANVSREAFGKSPLHVYPVTVVAVTSYTNKSNIDKCFEVGMTDVLHKPIDSKKLKGILDEFYFPRKLEIESSSPSPQDV